MSPSRAHLPFSRFPSALALSSSPPFPSRNGYSHGPTSRSHARVTRSGPDTRERFSLRARDRDCTRLRSQIHLALLAPSQARLRKAIRRLHLRGRSQGPTRQGFGAGKAGGHLRQETTRMSHFLHVGRVSARDLRARDLVPCPSRRTHSSAVP